MADAQERKRAKYHDLVEAGREAGYRTELLTIEVGLGVCCAMLTSRPSEQPSTLHVRTQAISVSS